MNLKTIKNNYINPVVPYNEWTKQYPVVDREYIWTYPLIHGPQQFNPEKIFIDSPIPILSKDMVIYIHTPACLFRCPMCPFYVEVVRSREQILGYADYIIREFMLYQETGLLEQYNLKAIYFGGGTASLLFPEDINRIITNIIKNIHCDSNLEITVEGHPTLADYNYLSALRETQVNRVSFGIQTFDEKELRIMGLRQTVKENYAAIENSLNLNFNTVSADMLYRLPNQNVEGVRKQLNQFLETGITSISTYSLELSVRQAEQQKLQADDECDKAMFYTINDELMKRNWNHTAQPDYSHKEHICQETIVTWTAPQGQTLGLGAGACSSLNNNTYHNVHDIAEYKKVLLENCLPILSGQIFSYADAMSRYMVLGTRSFVMKREPFKKAFGVDLADVFAHEIEQLSNLGLVELNNDSLVVTREGKYYVDNISKMFYSLENRCHLQPWGEKIKGAKATSYFCIK